MTATNKPRLETLNRALAAKPIAPAVAARRRRVRAQALANERKSPPTRAWIPAVMFAAAATLAVVISLGDGNVAAPPDLSIDPGAAAYVFAPEDAALADDIEFYHWLETAGNAG